MGDLPIRISKERPRFFYVEKIAGRFYVIEPTGNSFFAVGVNGLSTGDTQNRRDVVLDKFGNTDEYWNSITKSLRDIGVNTATGSFVASSKIQRFIITIKNYLVGPLHGGSIFFRKKFRPSPF